jgi:hypothetical protein
VTGIGGGAFVGCDSLTNIILPSSLVSIGVSAFAGCSSLIGITIPAYVTSIGDDAFYGNAALTAITVDTANAYYASDADGVLFNKEKTVLIQYPTGNARSDYAIPADVTAVQTIKVRMNDNSQSTAHRQTRSMAEGTSMSMMHNPKMRQLQSEQLLNRPEMASWQVYNNCKNIEPRAF